MTLRDTPPRFPRPAPRIVVFGLLASVLGAQSTADAATAAPALARPSAQPPGAVANWLGRYTNIAPETVVSVGDEYIVAVLSKRPLDAANPRVLRLEIRAEMTDADSQTANLLRSLSATLDINCADHTSHFVEVRTFAGPNLAGAEQVSHPAEGWVANPAGSYFQDVDAAVCTPTAPRPLLVAHAGLEGAGLERAGLEHGVAASQPSPQTLSAPLRPALSADAPMPRAAPAGHGSGQVQIAAAASQAKAEAALSELRGALPALMNGRSTHIERIERGGTAYYRALVLGFAQPADATSFCRQLVAAGRACISR